MTDEGLPIDPNEDTSPIRVIEEPIKI